jgi:hypothetical protein
MKCLKAIKEGKYSKVGDIIRIPDKDAMSKVESGYWMYVSKTEWKESKKPLETENSDNKNGKSLNKIQKQDKNNKKSKKV